MGSINEKLRKEIQKIIYQDLEVWKQHINNLENKKIDKITFKKHYVEYLQKIEETITHFTVFFLKKESHLVANQILEDDLKKTAMIETLIEFNPKYQKDILEITEIIAEKGDRIHKKFQPSVSSSPVKEEQPLFYSASEIE